VREALAQLRQSGALPGAFGEGIEAAVSNGTPLADALALFPDEVPREDVALIAAGEATGNLDKTLDRIAERHDLRHEQRRRFLTDILYPLILFHLAAFLTPMPPAVAKDGRLFGPTWVAGVLTILVPAYALVAAVLWLRRKAKGRDLLRRIVNVLPGFGNAARHRRRADFVDVLGAAYDAGVHLDRALDLAGRAVEEPRVDLASKVVARGGTLRDALGGTGILPAPMLGQIAVGEQSGELTKVLALSSREEAEAANHVLKRSTMVLAKIVYLTIALWIVFYYVSTVMGLYGPLLK